MPTVNAYQLAATQVAVVKLAATKGVTVSIIVGSRSYTSWRADPETVLITKPFTTHTYRQIIFDVIVHMRVNTIPLGIYGIRRPRGIVVSVIGKTVIVLPYQV